MPPVSSVRCVRPTTKSCQKVWYCGKSSARNSDQAARSYLSPSALRVNAVTDFGCSRASGERPDDIWKTVRYREGETRSLSRMALALCGRLLFRYGSGRRCNSLPHEGGAMRGQYPVHRRQAFLDWIHEHYP